MDKTYDDLREDNRVVMRHNIALNIDNFKAATDDFTLHTPREYLALQPATPPFMSIIIPNYNGRRFLEPLLEALQRQTFGDFEVILVDDASTDDSVAFVEKKYMIEDSNRLELRIITNRRNLGFVANCNAAADAARGRILVLLNNDTEPEDNWLAELAQTICENPQAAIVASKVLLYDQPSKLHTAGDLMGINGIPINRGVWEEDLGQYDEKSNIFSGSGCGTAIRKEVWQTLGGFDDDFWMYLEDVDLAFRAQLAGWQAVFAPNARIYHHLTATSGDTMASFYVGRNTLWTLAKNMPRGLLLRHLPEIVQAQVSITVDALRNIRGEAARARLRGQLAGLLGLPRQLRKREIIQARRLLEDGVLERRLV